MIASKFSSFWSLIHRYSKAMDAEMDETGGQREISNPGEVSSSANLAAEMKKSERTPGFPSADDADVDADDEQFHCLICLELVYKPIVQACGHVFCFWCIHQAMSSVGVSRCPLCRSPYAYFPRICELLHFLLLKAFPVDYRERAKEVLEQEQKMGMFSPQIDDLRTAETVDADSKLDTSACFEKLSKGESSQGDLITESGLANECNNIIYATERINNGTQSTYASSLCHESSSSIGASIDIKTCVSESEVLGKVKPCLSLCDKITVDDVLCSFCKELLYRPTVLNCGHAFCESCISINKEGKLKCQVCESLHPGDRPNVCLELHHYLERVFPIEYAERKKSVLVQQEIHQESTKNYSACAKEAGGATAEISEDQWQMENIHRCVGCDSCGMMPIIGTRFRCQDCYEKIGFDLCEKCYARGSMHHGRFNQQHTAEHRFEMIVTRPVLNEFSISPDVLGSFLWTGLIAPSPEEQQDDNGSIMYSH